jgi:hypothetical protein
MKNLNFCAISLNQCCSNQICGENAWQRMQLPEAEYATAQYASCECQYLMSYVCVLCLTSISTIADMNSQTGYFSLVMMTAVVYGEINQKQNSTHF